VATSDEPAGPARGLRSGNWLPSPRSPITFAELLRTKQIDVFEDKSLTRSDKWRFGIVCAASVFYFFVGGAFLLVLSESAP